MRFVFSRFMFVAVALFAQSHLFAQVPSTVALAAVPADVVAAIQAATAVDQFNIAGNMVLNEQVIKADVITLNNNAQATISVTGSWIAIVAKRLLIETPSSKAVIVRSPLPTAEPAFVAGRIGSTGAAGADGANGSGTNEHRHGNPGGPGTDGRKGGDGKTTPVPTVYIAAGIVETQQGNPPSQANLRLELNGIKGGAGGPGGRGGNGGSGATGREGRSEVTGCMQAAGTGGRGGDPGRGGQGGHAGTGGDGGTVFLIGNTTALNSMGYFEILQEGGAPGDRGMPGKQGTPGPAGGGGDKNGWCDGAGSGDGGKDSVGDLGVGEEAAAGTRGRIYRVNYNVDDLF